LAAWQRTALRLLPVCLFCLGLVVVGARWHEANQARAAREAAMQAQEQAEMIRIMTEERRRQDERAREERRRMVETRRERLRRDLRQEPERSALQAAVARDIFAQARARAPMMPAGTLPLRPDVMPPEQRQEWELEVERYAARHLRQAVRTGLQHAEKAVRLAASADEELSARRARAEGRLLAGDYRRAIYDFEWLETVMPGWTTAAYARCYQHLGQPVPARLQQAPLASADRRYPAAIVTRRANRAAAVSRLRQQLAGAELLERRWPRDAWLQMRMAAICFDLARQRAWVEEGVPPNNPDFFGETDAVLVREYPDLVRRGVEHGRKAVTLAKRHEERAPALEALGQGLLIQGSLDEAVAVLRRAASLDPRRFQATRYLRAAHARQGQSKPSRSAREDAQVPTPIRPGLDGMPRG
jgi:hypothetical protein